MATTPAAKPARGNFRPRAKRKVCYFCENKIERVDYKDVKVLENFISERGKILPRRATGACAKHQRHITNAVNIARNIGLLPYTRG